MKKVSAIICAYNEEKTIRDVLLSVASSSIFDEIIVVNDGSTDDTNRIITDCINTSQIINIHLSENKGKGYAMAVGIENSSAEIIVFCDADLSDLRSEHFQQLIKPIIENEVDMVLGQAMETLIDYKFNPFKSLTGERAILKKDILPILEDMKSSKFGVETLINLYYQSQEKRVKYVMLKGLKHPTKFEKTSHFQAVREFALEGHQIALIAFNNFNLISKVIINNINKL